MLSCKLDHNLLCFNFNSLLFRTKGQQNITYDQFLQVMAEMGAKRYGKGSENKLLNLVAGKAPKAVGTTVKNELIGNINYD